jgi:hypothetical protein
VRALHQVLINAGPVIWKIHAMRLAEFVVFPVVIKFPARNADPIATATTKCDLMRSAPNKETKPS